MKKPETQRRRQQKFWLILPLLALPFLTLAFWAIGGGQSTISETQLADTTKGLNLQLPEPKLNEKTGLSKLSLYQEVQRDQKQQDKTFPAFLQGLGMAGMEQETVITAASAANETDQPDQHEVKVAQQLAQLSTLLQPKPAAPPPAALSSPPGSQPVHQDRFHQDVAKLESLMQAMSRESPGQPADPAMQQIEAMLERIIDIQHPERVRSKLQPGAGYQLQPTLPVHSIPTQATVTLLTASPDSSPQATAPLQAITTGTGTAFYGLHGPVSESATATGTRTIAAAVHETQTVVAGGLIKMRLLQDVALGGSFLPKGSLVYGACRVNGERLSIEVRSVQTQQAILPVALRVYDLDGQEGLYIPGSVTRDAARQGADRAISQSLQLSPLSPSIGAQAAGAGISAAQGLFSRKTRQVKITLKAGYQLLLRDQHHRS